MGNDAEPEARMAWWNQEREWADAGEVVYIPSLRGAWKSKEVLEIAREFGEDYVVCPEPGGIVVWRA